MTKVSHFYFQQEMSHQQNAGLPGSPARHTIQVHKQTIARST